MGYMSFGDPTSAIASAIQQQLQAQKSDGGYADKAVSVLKAISNDPKMVDTMSPVIKAGLSVFEIGADAMVSTMGSSGGSSFSSAIIDLVSNISKEIADGVGQAVSVVGDAVPFVNAAIAFYNTAGSLQQAATDQKIQTCINIYYTPVVGTGSNGAIVPADLFVNSWLGGKAGAVGPNGKIVVPPVMPTAVPSDVGQALIAMTEPEYELNLAAMRTFLKQPKLGIPSNIAANLKAMRIAIQESARNPSMTDGGKFILPMYIDTIAGLFRDGYLSNEYAQYRWALNGGNPSDPCIGQNALFAALSQWDNMSPQSHGSAVYTCLDCHKWDQRAINSALKMKDDWLKSAYPTWAPDIAAQAKLLSNIRTLTAQALAKHGIKIATPASSAPLAAPKLAVVRSAPTLSSVTVSTKKPTSSVVAIGAGVVLAAGALVALEVVRRRKLKMRS